MGNKDVRNYVLAFALAVSGLLLYKGLEARTYFANIISQQERINTSLDVHINTFQTLEAQTEGWDDGLRHIADAYDLLAMFDLIGFERMGLRSSVDSFQLVSANPYMVKNIDVGLVSVCVDGGGKPLSLHADNYGQLLDGLEAMAKTGDFTFSYLDIQGGSRTAISHVGNLCVLLNANLEDQA